MQFGRTCAAGVHCSNIIYIFGGYSANVNQSVERYRISENVWDLLTFDLPEKLWQHACFALDD
jgi:hypothetical protein